MSDEPFRCICDPDDLFEPPDPTPRAVEGCPAHRARRAAQLFMTQPPMADGVPGRQHLTGYRLRGYEDLIAKLAASRQYQRITLDQLAERMDDTGSHISRTLHGGREARGRRLFALADALGYDLALVPREEA